MVKIALVVRNGPSLTSLRRAVCGVTRSVEGRTSGSQVSTSARSRTTAIRTPGTATSQTILHRTSYPALQKRILGYGSASVGAISTPCQVLKADLSERSAVGTTTGATEPGGT